MKSTKITVAYGDGIGPEIMEATLKIISHAGARISLETIEIGQAMYEKGYSSGIPDHAWRSIHESKVFLKAPITTPQGGGYKSLNVTIRKALGLYANVRPCMSFAPYVKSLHPELNMTIIRENEEDLYAGVEYRPTHNMLQSVKLISKTGSEKIIKYAFEYAVKNNRRKVTCITKDNIMKITDGGFHRIFDLVGARYPNIEKEHYIVDIGAARIASRPQVFDVIVTENLYGDIISDIAAEVSGSVGLAGSANIGDEYAMFEAIHGSAPLMAGKNTANPSGLLNGAIMMLVHIGQGDVAEKVHNAFLKTLEDGMHTKDIYNESHSKAKLGTAEFAEAVIERLGEVPENFKQVKYSTESSDKGPSATPQIDISEQKTLVGVDVFINHLCEKGVEDLASSINKLTNGELKLKMISTMGLKVWPIDSSSSTKQSDHWSLRFTANGKSITHKDINMVLAAMAANGIDYVATQSLYTYGNTVGFSLAQGE
jgi:isocitrate dehydrogenase